MIFMTNVVQLFLNHSVVLVDTNILMDESPRAERFFSSLCDTLARTGSRICLLEDVVLEVYSHFTGTAKKATPISRRRAILADHRIRMLLDRRLAYVYRNNQHQGFFDAGLIAFWSQDISRKCALISSDMHLHSDLVNTLAELANGKGEPIRCYTITEDGTVARFCGDRLPEHAR